MKIIFNYVRRVLEATIKEFYNGGLQYDIHGWKGSEREGDLSINEEFRQYRSGTNNWSEPYSNKERYKERQHRQIEDMIHFFKKHGMDKGKSGKSERIAKLLIEGASSDGLTPNYLYELYEEESDKRIFEEEILKQEFRIMKTLDRRDILIVLGKCNKPIDYFLGFFSGEKLKELNVERDEIRKYLFGNNLNCEIFDDKYPADLFRHVYTEKKYTVLHIAMHGSSGELAFIK